MIDYHRFCQIKHVHAHDGLHASQIAQAVSLDRRTVAYWLTQEHFRPRKPRPHASTLDPFKPDMVRLLERHPSSAAQIFQRLREQGFTGSYELVKADVRTVRPRRQPAFLTLAFAPGACAQVDWGAFGWSRLGTRTGSCASLSWCCARAVCCPWNARLPRRGSTFWRAINTPLTSLGAFHTK